ncbi:unnamed protein product [Brassica oleracea var. botrytis]
MKSLLTQVSVTYSLRTTTRYKLAYLLLQLTCLFRVFYLIKIF